MSAECTKCGADLVQNTETGEWECPECTLEAKLDVAREALEGAARSLEAAGNAGREDSLIADLESLRPWAKARARLVREALAKLGASAPAKCPKCDGAGGWWTNHGIHDQEWTPCPDCKPAAPVLEVKPLGIDGVLMVGANSTYAAIVDGKVVGSKLVAPAKCPTCNGVGRIPFRPGCQKVCPECGGKPK